MLGLEAKHLQCYLLKILLGFDRKYLICQIHHNKGTK